MTQLVTDVSLNFVEDRESLHQFWSWVETSPPSIAFDLETSGLRPFEGDWIRLFQVGDSHTAFAFPERWAGACVEFMNSYSGLRIAHNHPFDCTFLELDGHVPNFLDQSKMHDTMFMAKLLWPNKQAKLKPLVQELIDPNARDGEKALKDAMRKGGWGYDDVPVKLPEYWAYGCLDVIYTHRLYYRLLREFQKYQEELWKIYELEMYIAPTYRHMRTTGVHVDRDAAEALDGEYKNKTKELSRRIQEEFGCRPTQNTAIAEKLVAEGVELTERTKTGKVKLTKEVLETVDHPLAEMLRQHRTFAKLHSTYTANILEFSARDGKLHAETNQIEADTGRSAMRRPNLQNVPQRGGSQVRNLLVASEGCILVSCDYSQQELRNLAHFSQDPNLKKIFAEGGEPFLLIGSMMFDEPLTSKDDPRRADVKALVYGLIFGMGIKKYARDTGKPMAEAREILDRFHDTFPGVRQYMNKTIRDAEAMHPHPHAFTAFGRKVACDPGFEYKLCNYRIQGTASDQTKLAVARIQDEGLGERLRIVIHDEVVLEVPEEQGPDVAKRVERYLIEAGSDVLTVPFEAEAKLAYRFGEFKE